MRVLLLTAFAAAALLAFGCQDGDSDGGVGLPEGIPTFTGAQQEPGVTHNEGDDFLGVWRTSEDVASVQAFFEEELQGGSWRVVETREVADGVVIRIEEEADPAHSGSIVIRTDEGGTRIVKAIGRDDDGDDAGGNGDDDGASGDDGDSGGDSGEGTGGLPDGYPSDVALPDDAQIVSSTAPLVGTTQFYLVEFTTETEPADVIAYFNDSLAAEGWDVGAAENDPGSFALNFSRDDARILITGGASEDGTDASIAIVVEG